MHTENYYFMGIWIHGFNKPSMKTMNMDQAIYSSFRIFGQIAKCNSNCVLAMFVSLSVNLFSTFWLKNFPLRLE